MDRLTEVKARYEALGDTPAPCAADGVFGDVPWLIAEVERLRAVCDVVYRLLYRGRTVGGPKPDLLDIEERLRLAAKGEATGE